MGKMARRNPGLGFAHAQVDPINAKLGSIWDQFLVLSAGPWQAKKAQ